MHPSSDTRGFRIYTRKENPRMYHSGGTMGFRTYIERFTSDNLTIIVLCNRTDLDPEQLALQVACPLLP
jgi:hypothetical protein